MKKVKKVLVDVLADVGVAPVWFVSAMERVEHKIEHVVPSWFVSAMEEIKKEVSLLARKDEMASSFHTIIDMLDERATKDDFRKLEARLDRTMKTLSNHETRIIHLEGNLPAVSLEISR